ncbi:hypothetical protein AC579_1363 [Pseudocercospora musae]|uniref:Uncharacterized protein n=1 Tax=Pseudocercospora musae TaxID=113226 RepID=A0A139IL31_9PEZI|nr:hypothetical protein AC579_1363 [Pseudocercospora musae]
MNQTINPNILSLSQMLSRSHTLSLFRHDIRSTIVSMLNSADNTTRVSEAHPQFWELYKDAGTLSIPSVRILLRERVAERMYENWHVDIYAGLPEWVEDGVIELDVTDRGSDFDAGKSKLVLASLKLVD